jgi:hypothetical protein
MRAANDDTDAAIYLGILGAIYAGCTYIAAARDIDGGLAFGCMGVVIVLICGAVARRLT